MTESDATGDKDLDAARDVLATFNDEGTLDDPGDPDGAPTTSSPADDSETPAPG